MLLCIPSATLNVGDHDGDMSERKLTERQQKMLNLIKESPTITGKQMSETLSVSQRTIERDLSALQKIGVLKREGKDNAGMWVVDGWNYCWDYKTNVDMIIQGTNNYWKAIS